MTDLQTLKDLYDRAGVAYNETSCPPDYGLHATTMVQVHAQEGAQQIGYAASLFDHYFDADEALVAVGAWED